MTMTGTRRIWVRISVLVAIAMLATLLVYSQTGLGKSLSPMIDVSLDGARHNRQPLGYPPGQNGMTRQNNKAQSQPQSQNQGQTQGNNQGQPVATVKGKELVGEDWKRNDANKIPDIVSLNLDDQSAPRTQPIPGQSAGDPSDPYSAINQLIPNLVPSNVHFMWCGSRWFEFKYYLSILSVMRTVKPDKVVLHYEIKPVQDKLFYNQWLRDLEHDYPFFTSQQMNPQQAKFCQNTRDVQLSIILDLLFHEGGMYVGENTWILDFPAKNRAVDVDFSLEQNSMDGYILYRAGTIKNKTQALEVMATQLEKVKDYQVKRHECATTNQLYNGLQNPHCLVVKGGVFDRFYPSDIWELDDPFGKVCRKLFYGTSEILKPKPSYDTLVPNIGHMIWIGGNPMDFVFYLSVLSFLYVVEVDTVFIHGDVPPTGPYWIRLMNNQPTAHRIKFITRPPPLLVYQGVIEPYYRALMSDIIRVDLMIKYGGIYADTDAIWVKPLSAEDRGYDAVASYDWVDWSYPYPDSVNFGLSYGKRNAPFWRIFRDSMRSLHNHIHGFTGVMMPYKLLEKFPHLLRIDRHLQVICYQFRCHPTWVKNYHNMSIDHVTSGSLNNWRQSVNALHWTHPNPPELYNETMLAKGSGIFADVGRMVLRKAGLL